MRKIILLPSILLAAFSIFAQVPQKFNYQAVARDAAGEIMGNQPISIRFSILDGSPSGTSIYTEEHTSITTNNLGLFKISIGTGTPLSGTFSAIDWAAGNRYLKIELNIGTGYQTMGNEQLVSVPYALYAESSGSSTENQSLSSTTSGNNVTVNITGGTGTSFSVEDADSDPANELQMLSLNGSTLSISGGNSVTVPTGNNFDYSNLDVSASTNAANPQNGNSVQVITVTTTTSKRFLLSFQGSLDFAPTNFGISAEFKFNIDNGSSYIMCASQSLPTNAQQRNFPIGATVYTDVLAPGSHTFRTHISVTCNDSNIPATGAGKLYVIGM